MSITRSFNIHEAAREFVATHGPGATAVEMAAEFADTIPDEQVREAFEGLAEQAIRMAVHSRRSQAIRPGVSRHRRAASAMKTSLAARVEEFLIYTPDGCLKSLKDATLDDVQYQAVLRFEAAAAMQSAGERWVKLGETMKDRNRKTVNGLDPGLVLNILGEVNLA